MVQSNNTKSQDKQRSNGGRNTMYHPAKDAYGQAWYENHQNLLLLVNYLHAQGSFGDPDDVIYFFEKPWKWTLEWGELQMQLAKGPGPLGGLLS